MAEKQKVLWIQEQRNIDLVKVPVEAGKRLKDEKNRLCWQRLREYCYPIHGLGNGQYMIVDSRWSLPVSPYKDLITQEDLEILCDNDEVRNEAFTDIGSLSERDRQKAQTADLLLWSLIIIIFGFVLFLFSTSNVDVGTMLGVK